MQELQETQVWFLGQEDSLEEEMATHCCILAWEISWTEEAGRLQSMGLQRVKQDQACMHKHVYCCLFLNYEMLHLWDPDLFPKVPYMQLVNMSFYIAKNLFFLRKEGKKSSNWVYLKIICWSSTLKTICQQLFFLSPFSHSGNHNPGKVQCWVSAYKIE